MEPVRLDLRVTPEAEAVAKAAAALRGAGVALLPAEGVYGLHVLATAGAAVARLRAAKERETRRGFIGLLGRPEEIWRWAGVEPVALALARAHWPGPLTLVLPALPSVPDAARAADGTVALRCPGAGFLRTVVEAVGDLVLSTSANRPGLPPATLAGDAPVGAADLIVDAGPLSGIPSTVVRVETGAVVVLREGAISFGGKGPLTLPPAAP